MKLRRTWSNKSLNLKSQLIKPQLNRTFPSNSDEPFIFFQIDAEYNKDHIIEHALEFMEAFDRSHGTQPKPMCVKNTFELDRDPK